MPRFVVFLRGVNVGKGNRVPMAQFKKVLESLGYTDISTLLNSGNAVFSSSGRSAGKHAAVIRGALAEQIGVDVLTIVKSSAELSAIAAGNPLAWRAKDASRLLVAFAQDAAAIRALAPLTSLVEKSEKMIVGREAAYLYCPDGVLASKAAVALLGPAGQSITTRNWATVLKVKALLEEGDD